MCQVIYPPEEFPPKATPTPTTSPTTTPTVGTAWSITPAPESPVDFPDTGVAPIIREGDGDFFIAERFSIVHVLGVISAWYLFELLRRNR